MAPRKSAFDFAAGAGGGGRAGAEEGGGGGLNIGTDRVDMGGGNGNDLGRVVPTGAPPPSLGPKGKKVGVRIPANGLTYAFASTTGPLLVALRMPGTNGMIATASPGPGDFTGVLGAVGDWVEGTAGIVILKLMSEIGEDPVALPLVEVITSLRLITYQPTRLPAYVVSVVTAKPTITIKW